MRVLLVTPPMVQFNAPYPAVPVLAAHLERLGHEAAQEDLSLALALRLFSGDGLRRVVRALRRRRGGRRGRSAAVRHLLAHARDCIRRVGDVIRFLQGRAPELAGRIAGHGWLPEGPRMRRADAPRPDADLHEIATHRASLFIDDLADAVREGLDARFELARYGERLAADRPSFDDLDRALRSRPGLLDRMIDDLAARAVRRHRPDLVGVTAPFPGAVYGAFRVARAARRARPGVRTVLGGGYVNTELRGLSDPRVFETFDFVTLDDGEVPLGRILEFAAGRVGAGGLVRTLRREGGRVVGHGADAGPALRHRDRAAPRFPPAAGRYVAMAESDNPMHRLWSARRWNKLTLAHGCYWRRCAFCDTSLDHIRRFDPADAGTVHAWIRAAVRETGETGFHFTDEAAPPALLRSLADRLLAGGPAIEWWANIRFERSFTPELAARLAASGCVAVTGGLETACDRTLRRMDKGVTVRQAVRVLRAFARAGVLTHAYLMYGFPTQTAQETVDALELVRQLFAAGWLQSAYWHRFALTVHSAMHRVPARHGIRLAPCGPASFARNEAAFVEPGAPDHAGLGAGLRRATFNYLRGAGLDEDVRRWFDFPVPRPRWAADTVRRWAGR